MFPPGGTAHALTPRLPDPVMGIPGLPTTSERAVRGSTTGRADSCGGGWSSTTPRARARRRGAQALPIFREIMLRTTSTSRGAGAFVPARIGKGHPFLVHSAARQAVRERRRRDDGEWHAGRPAVAENASLPDRAKVH